METQTHLIDESHTLEKAGIDCSGPEEFWYSGNLFTVRRNDRLALDVAGG